jgi:hypothetical protein
LWDESADQTVLIGSSTQTGNAQLTGTLTVGVDDTGHDVKFFGATATNGYMLWDESTDDLILGSSSKIGIGTTAPSGLLSITGTGDAIRVESTNTGAGGAQIDLLHFTTSPADDDNFGVINMGGYYTGTTSVYGTVIKGIWTDVSARNAALSFSTNSAGTIAEKMRIDSTGSVGIGTTAPASPLHVASGTQPALRVSHSSVQYATLFGYDGLINILDDTDGNHFRVQFDGTQRFKVTATGQLYATTNGTRPMQFINTDNSTNGGWGWWVNNFDNFDFGFHADAAGDRLTLTRGGNLTVSGTVSGGSDEGWKDNIVTISDGLGVVEDLNPVTFDWKPNIAISPDGSGIGFVAQEVEDVIPLAVTGVDFDGVDDEHNRTGKAVSILMIVPYLTKAIQELSAKVKVLEDE